MPKKALITGITGQDGSYLAEFLLSKGYEVHGLKRKSSSFNTERIDHIYEDKKYAKNFFLHYGDLTDSSSIFNLINKIRPNEIYNLGAQSHVGVSFHIPEYTSEVTGIGTLRILEAIRILNLEKKYLDKDVFIIGGPKIINQCFDIIKEFYLTRIYGNFNCEKFIDLSKIKKTMRLSKKIDSDETCHFEIWKK